MQKWFLEKYKYQIYKIALIYFLNHDIGQMVKEVLSPSFSYDSEKGLIKMKT